MKNVKFRKRGKMYSETIFTYEKHDPNYTQQTINYIKFCIRDNKSIHVSCLISQHSNLVNKITNVLIFLVRLKSFLNWQHFFPTLACWFDVSWVIYLCCGLFSCIVLLSLSRNLARVCQRPTRHLWLSGHVGNAIILKQASYWFWHIFIRSHVLRFRWFFVVVFLFIWGRNYISND